MQNGRVFVKGEKKENRKWLKTDLKPYEGEAVNDIFLCDMETDA